MRTLAAILLLAIVLCSASCADYTEVITLKGDGTATIKSQATLSGMVAQLLGNAGGQDDTGQQPTPQGSTRTWREHQGEMLLINREMTFKDFRQQPQLDVAGPEFAKYGAAEYKVESLGFGRYKLTRPVSLQSAQDALAGGAGGGDNPLGKFGGLLGKMGSSVGKSLIDSTLAGHEFKVTLNAPLILSSNADTKNGSTDATWTRQLNTLVGPEAKPLTIEATVLLIDYPLVGGIAGGVVLLLIIWIALALRGKSRRTGMPAPRASA